MKFFRLPNSVFLTLLLFVIFTGGSGFCAKPMPDGKLLWIADKFKAYDVELKVGENSRAKCHLLIPREEPSPMAAVICRPVSGGSVAEVSGVGMAKDTPQHEFGRLLAEVGYVVIVPPANENARSREAETRCVIEYLKRQSFVNGNRIGYYSLSSGADESKQLEPLLGDLAVAVIAKQFYDPAPTVLLPPDAKGPDAKGPDAKGPDAKGKGKQIAQGLGAFDILNRCLRPDATVGRDYQYTPGARGRRIVGMPFEGGNPFDIHRLDNRAKTSLRGCFWMPDGARQFHGMALKISRDGYPGPLRVRFGSMSGGDDLGTAILRENDVTPLFDTWHKALVDPKTVAGGKTIYYEITTGPGRSPDDNYVVYGPRNLDNKLVSGESFPFAYRVLTDRAQDDVDQPGKEYAYQFTQEMTAPYYRDDAAKKLRGGKAKEDETAVDGTWKIRFDPKQDKQSVLATAAEDLRRFLKYRAGISVDVVDKTNADNDRIIDLIVGTDKNTIGGINTDEGYSIEIEPMRIVIAARTPRGAMRGVYWLEDAMRFRDGPFLKRVVVQRNCKYRRRITCTVCPSDIKYTETSYPLPYTDGLLRHISHQGFNAVWLIVSQGEVVVDSKIYPELNEPQAARRLERMRDLVARGKRFGVDVILYFGNEFCSVPGEFYKKYPHTRGAGPCYVGGTAMCSSHPDVRRFVAEITSDMFRRVPGLGGLCEIYDSEVYKHCATGNRKACPRCKDRSPEDIAAEALANLDAAMRSVDADTDLIAWTYLGHFKPWAVRTIAKFSKQTIFQANFARHVPIVRGGVTNRAEDYIISELGPSDYFKAAMKKARVEGLRLAAKTEHATALEFVMVPYYPCLQQWCARAEKLGEFPLDTLFATYCHYGYTPGRTADVLKSYSWTNGPTGEELLRLLARRDFGPGTEDDVVEAWEHFTRGIRYFPYSNPVNKYPGPLQTGPSQPLFLDPKVKRMGTARAWQNDINWCRPWGPKITAEYLGRMVDEYALGIACLRKAQQSATAHGKAELAREIGVAETIKRSLTTMINMIRWIPLRDAYAAAKEGGEKDKIRKQLIAVGRDELINARGALKYVEADSRLGAASNGNGSPGRGGLFTPALIRKKIGLLEDTLQRQLAADNQ